MRDVYVYTLFDNNNRPRCTGIKIGDTVTIYDLFRFNTGVKFGDIEPALKSIRKLIITANQNGHRIITANFKDQLAAFNLPIVNKSYNVYDLLWFNQFQSDTVIIEHKLVRGVLDKLEKQKLHEYHKIAANAAVVYHDLQRRGVYCDYELVHPIWSQNTFSGRGKTKEFNLQGLPDGHRVYAVGGCEADVLVHFDWICADIRIAALLSNDMELNKSFIDSDPYEYMRALINRDAPDGLSRDECKLLLLKAINSMDISNEVLTDIYKSLGKWIVGCYNITCNSDGCLETILKRRFKVAHAKNKLAVLNGVMQGSVAHAMQLTMRRVWEKYPEALICENHDALIMASAAEPKEINKLIDGVVDIMLHPFANVLPNNPCFPLKVSVGKKWKQWRIYKTYRESGVTHATKQ